MAAPNEEGLLEMVVESVRVQTRTNQHVVILRERDRARYLPIWIGPWEANAIAIHLQGTQPARPLTHDTFTATVSALGAEIRRVVIADLADETFHASVFIGTHDGGEIEIDARPSDALALAVRTGASIFASPGVLRRAGKRVDESGDEDDDSESGDEGLAIFRDFVNSLEIDSGGEHPEGPAAR